MHLGLHVGLSLILSDFDQNWNTLTNCITTSRVQAPSRSVYQYTRVVTWGRTGGHGYGKKSNPQTFHCARAEK
jgi:hypothetical protein